MHTVLHKFISFSVGEPPKPPKSLTVEHTCNGVTLSWSPGESDSRNPIQHYDLACTNLPPIKVPPAPEGQMLTAVISGLEKGKTYTISVTAVNSIRHSEAIETTIKLRGKRSN